MGREQGDGRLLGEADEPTEINVKLMRSGGHSAFNPQSFYKRFSAPPFLVQRELLLGGFYSGPE